MLEGAAPSLKLVYLKWYNKLYIFYLYGYLFISAMSVCAIDTSISKYVEPVRTLLQPWWTRWKVKG